jgi:hypothetical protein
MGKREVVYTPEPTTEHFEIEYFNEYQVWEHAHGTWRVFYQDYYVPAEIYSEKRAREIAEALAGEGTRTRVVKVEEG